MESSKYKEIISESEEVHYLTREFVIDKVDRAKLVAFRTIEQKKYSKRTHLFLGVDIMKKLGWQVGHKVSMKYNDKRGILIIYKATSNKFYTIIDYSDTVKKIIYSNYEGCVVPEYKNQGIYWDESGFEINLTESALILFFDKAKDGIKIVDQRFLKRKKSFPSDLKAANKDDKKIEDDFKDHYIELGAKLIDSDNVKKDKDKGEVESDIELENMEFI